MVRAAKEFDACYVFVGALTLYGKGKELYYRILENHFTELLPKYRQLFKTFNQPSREYQWSLERRAKMLCDKAGIKYGIV
ncbi:hypothetical protein AFULGI_00017000 [Archaeoglobus fulgidus DSM 8774]|jgi:hypothetical protein|uniref:Uncharacterized protein n=1 Tax=Archaeoglobus fulgidus DSM 8774 TaxID=1344584 RepID=A0A075WH93_ARCFL|nr:hypothetical protein [Archaeoglobus fulgidus]AIG98459.1 hypothetical protein AFULGI_00017000 [Archaeoglobus fulgidus DSM 8774]